MWQKLANAVRAAGAVRQVDMNSTLREVFEREEQNGSRALLLFRLFVVVLLVVGGATAAQRAKDIVTNLIFAAAYGSVVTVQWYLHRKGLRRAEHRFAYAAILADHAVFTFQIIFYYTTQGTGNFNFAMKSPYLVLLLMPTLTTLLQFRLSLLFFSLAISLGIFLSFYGFALLSGVPQSDSWAQYFIGETIILPAWLGLWLLLPLFIAGIIAYTIVRSVRMVTQIGHTESQKLQLARYFSPSVVEEIAASAGSSNALTGSERRSVAVFFADIRSFTSLSEKLPPDEVAAMLSELRQLQIQAVFASSGMVDKFIGDAVMAVFGVPRSAGSFALDVQNAVRCGVHMFRLLGEFNARRTALGHDEIRIGIGIHAGEAFAGNLGGDSQLEYTVIGDVVNTASRIEHLCKKAGADFLVSETVAAELGPEFRHEKIGVVKIRGREQPLGIYKILHGI